LNLFQVGKGIEFHPPMLPQSPSPSAANGLRKVPATIWLPSKVSTGGGAISPRTMRWK